MKLLIHLFFLVVQCVVTFVALLAIYMLFVLLDYQGGIEGFIGVTIIQPLLGSIIAGITIMLCLLIGLPIRVFKNLNTWWSEKYFISFTGIITGFALLVTSMLPSMQDRIQTIIDGDLVRKDVPNVPMVLSGWFCFAFFALHAFPPRALKRWAKSKIHSLNNQYLL